ncbi:MAG: PAS domain-containing protein [Mucilaginibacter sp.]
MRPDSKFLNSLFEVAHIEFQSYDLHNHQLVFSSGLAQKLLGYSEDEYFKLSNDFYKSIVHPDDFQRVQKTIKEIIKSNEGDIVEMTVRMRKSDGSYIWTSSRQMILERNRSDHVFTIIREVEDVTKLVEVETELEEKIKQLKLVSFKNSHLLRSPVASILGLVDIVDQRGIASEHNRQILKFLKEAITTLDQIIHEINDAAQV